MTQSGKRGFGSMDPKKQREIASRGGKASHAKGTAHEWTSEEARAAGRLGGMTSRTKRQKAAGLSPEDLGATSADSSAQQ